ncbi:hypothetical protein MVLG_03326 [Microbotryum lychnidis-dioicae p1A1 Lamole]|uniref:Protein kinase domain-containing protein n=1 Tax=Microbotryum lychnidis-dioicae (strain p1A1 Lamole / MvSl-1064) TaxID=683840 RepID=U5H7V6_USTV1|nr:hypothetical protein MVLG_03326 [Microbotryum lychnidis-dioicae p1A1 Lamole]|eukprot:KDE06286.1 hypothetical protein MVLG_03326 [Microbotryum lychnidis-dioicae p1A1 Lamole]
MPIDTDADKDQAEVRSSCHMINGGLARSMAHRPASPDPELDALVEDVTFAGTWGQEEPMQALFDQINAVGPAVRRIVASGGLSVPVPTSEEQQHHSDQAPDAVTLFTFASNEAIEAAWKMSNEDWRREEARLGRHPTDRRQVNQVLFPGEIKGGPKAGAAARQILRRFYRLKSTVALREFVYGFTLAVDRFRVLCHMPGGIVQTNEFNCSRPEGFKVLLRFLVRLVVDTELNLGAIVSGAAYPLTVNTLPPFVYQRPTSAGSAANVHHRARLWAPTNRKDAMTGNRTAYYPAAVEKDGATASYRRSPEQTVAFSFPTSEQSKRTIRLLERLDTFHSTTIEGLATVETIYQDPQAFRTAPPDVCGGDAGCLSGGVTSRTTQFIEYRELYQSILQAQSTHHLTQLILDAVKGVRSLYQIDVLHRDLSIENLVIKPDGTGALMLSDCFCFLDDALSEQERLEAVSTAANLERFGYAGHSSNYGPRNAPDQQVSD